MVVLPRSEVKRSQVSGILTCILAIVVLIGIGSNFMEASEGGQVAMILLGLLALAAIVFAVLQIVAFRAQSQAVILHEGDHFVIATNHLHEGFKLRFFRDVLNENIVSFSDEERERWSVLEKVGFHAVFYVRNVRKPVLLPLCFMLFDEVFVVDHTRRWDYFNSRNTSEPTYSSRGIGPFDLDAVIPDTKQ